MKKLELVKNDKMTLECLLLVFDLYWLRYKKPGDNWYELTDYLREKLNEDGIKICYDDKNKDISFGLDFTRYSVNRNILK